MGGGGGGAYGASKAAVIHLTQSYALDLAPYDINVNVICPGSLWTPMWERIAERSRRNQPALAHLTPRQIFEKAIRERCPLGREQTPEDIGKAAAFPGLRRRRQHHGPVPQRQRRHTHGLKGPGGAGYDRWTCRTLPRAPTLGGGHCRLAASPSARASGPGGRPSTGTPSLHHCWEQLEAAGNFNNLRLAAGSGEGEFRGMLFADSDVYKWLEAVAYDLAARPDARLQGRAEEAIDLLAAAQSDDGYLNSYWQVVEPDRRWQDLGRGHEMYCAGHLMQAAVAYHRTTGHGKLLDVARRFADHIDSVFGPTGRPGIPGIRRSRRPWWSCTATRARGAISTSRASCWTGGVGRR